MGRWWMLFFLVVAGTLAWLLGLGDVIRASVAAGHLLDWVMGGLCFLWLIIILKAPWDLYFQAHEVAFELQRSHERRVPVAAGREEYIRSLRRRLLWLSVGAHLFSAVLVGLVAYLVGHASCAPSQRRRAIPAKTWQRSANGWISRSAGCAS